MEKKNNYVNKNIINIILAGISIAIGFLFIYINLFQYKYGLNADIASEGLLAKIIWNSKEWIPDEWYGSTETRVLSLTHVAALFYGITEDICLSMGLSSIVGMVLVLHGAYGLCKELELNVTQKCWFLLLILILPNNKNQIELMHIFAGHYAIHISVYLYAMIYYLKILKGVSVKKIYLFILSGCFFLLGMQGARALLMITGPMLAAEGIRIGYQICCNRKMARTEIISIAYVISLNIAAFLGGKMPTSVGYALSRNIRKAPQKFIGTVLPDFLNTLDWKGISAIEKIVFLGLICLTLWQAVRILMKGIKKQELKLEEIVFMNFGISVSLTIAALTFTTVDSSSRYFVIIFLTMAIAFVITWKQRGKILKSVIAFSIIIILIGNTCRVYYPMIIDKSYVNNTYQKIGEFLIQEGYENAYTNFDHANTITVINDDKVQVSAVSSFSSMEISKWLTSKNWYVPSIPMNSKTAYIVSDYRLEEFKEFLEKHRDTVKFEVRIGEFNIYGSEYNYSKLAD